MRVARSGGLRLSTVVTIITLVVVVIYALYILPMAYRGTPSGEGTFQKIPEKPAVPVLPEPVVPRTTARTQAPVQVIMQLPARTVAPVSVSVPTEIRKPQEEEIKEEFAPFPEPIQFLTPGADKSPAVLVVGGTDGSGTRRVVQLLTDLGVTMISEDPETYDIHADLVKGWPEVVNPVVLETKTLDYQPQQLSPAVQNKARSDVGAILGQVQRDSSKPQSFKLAVGGVLPHPIGVTTAGVRYGFKAPVAMTLAPWFAELSPHFKLVHAVRDGRDISFSANQGPVDKFFVTMYGNSLGSLPPPVKGIKLWSDWNSQVYKWAQRYAQEVMASTSNNGGSGGSSGDRVVEKSFGYFALHSEDLVAPSVAVRYAAIRHLASFVGSSLTAQQLCCLALKESDFMGSHDRTPINKRAKSGSTVTKRYGKWHAQLDANPRLSEQVHREGAEGLRIFGYEPLRQLAGDDMRGPEGDFCSAEVAGEGCANLPRSQPQPPPVDFSAFAVPGMCTTEAGIDFIAGDLEAVPMPPQDPTGCCRKCKEYAGCAYFVVDPASDMCYLKARSIGGTKKKASLVAGTMVS